VQSIGCLDKVFLTGTFTDTFYARKRDKLTLIAIACTKAAPTCFCGSMGVDPGTASFADILLSPTAEGWNVRCQTEKGKAVEKALSGVVKDTTGQALPVAVPELKVNLDAATKKISGMFDHPIWNELYRPCLGCGTCTFVCPSCYCFEMGPQMRGDGGTEMRFWDSCMFSEYTRMAGGHNPRPSTKERLRNRYLHKLSYFSARCGENLCVGCGRCVEKCPVGLDISKVVQMIGELSRPCLGCGTCTFVCPSCYCFEMGPEMRGAAGTEMRFWDSCMFSEYTRMAGGHNPRPSTKERLRNRYLHKLSYFSARCGDNLCVGCGRCVEKCPVGLDISKVVEMIGEATV